MRAFSILFTALLALLMIAGCSEKSEDIKKISSLEQLNSSDYIIGAEIGTIALSEAEKRFPNAKVLTFKLITDLYPALRAGKIDAIAFDKPPLDYAALNDDKLMVFPETIGVGHISIGSSFEKRELVEKVNEFIAKYRADGTYDEMYKRWTGMKNPVIPDIPVPENPQGVLTIGTCASNEPMSFYGPDREPTGFDVEFSRRLASYLNMELKLVVIDYESLFPASASGRIDLAVANMDATPERRETVLFTDEYVDAPIALMILKERFAGDRNASFDLEELNKPSVSIGVPQGARAMETAEKVFPKADIKYYQHHPDAYIALNTKKLDAFVYDRHAMQYALTTNPDLVILDKNIGDVHIAVGLPKSHTALRDEVNAFIAKYRADGTYDDMYDRWLNSKNHEMPDIPAPKNPTRTFNVLTFGQDVPMSFYGKDGELTGFDLEFAKRLALHLNAEMKITPIDYPSMIVAAESGKADMIIASLNKTPERAEKINYSDSYVDSAIAIMVHKDKLASKNEETKVVKADNENETITDVSQLKNKKLGIYTGSTADTLVLTHLPDSLPVYFKSYPEMIIELKNKRIAGFLVDEPLYRIFVKKEPLITRLDYMLMEEDYALAFSHANRELCEEFSVEIRKMKEDGTLKKLEDKWFGDDESVKTVFKSELESPKATLKYATVPELEPFTCLIAGNVVGYDIEVANLAAEKLGYKLEPVIMDWGGYLESVFSGKVDLGVGCTSVTEERKENIAFSEPTYKSGIVIAVLKEQSPLAEKAKEPSFWDNLKASFERTFLREQRWKLIVQGLWVTVLITVLAAVAGTILAFGVCALRRSKNIFLRLIGRGYVALMQGTPILVILMILYYIIFAKCDIDAIIVAIIGFALNFAAYAGEMLRTGIDAVPAGHIEAGKALSLTRFQTFRKVIFPQAARQILPIYRGEFINMLKMTSIVGYIAIQDLTKMSDIIRSRTYEAFFPLIATAVIYFAVAWILASLLNLVDRKLDPIKRRRSFKNGGCSK